MEGQLKEISLFDNEDLSSNGQADLKDSANENMKQRTDIHVQKNHVGGSGSIWAGA